ncbi:GDSL-type esterase/lipase family protein [Kribbella sp. CA-293567]|uniref:GDSL-type esterase/lipase family protein n=1 Tax=Kribbella sp. CA-293567 TaxID=3002436 RepID=UPI0022DD2A5D|nr:GDSL-type esterase/lipase family protein [Kribbella sp. CA-293567]WBQ02878.1 GDSL-type esterase/lipase family protein [Kribbella sp. CA-293567]
MTSWTTTPIDQRLVRGAVELETTSNGVLPHRLPAWARAQTSDGQLAMAEAQPSGVRIAFRTAATAIELDVLPTKVLYAGAPAGADGVYDLLVDGRLTAQATASGGNVLTIDLMNGSTDFVPGRPATVGFTGLRPGAKDVEIWLPHRERTELVALRTDAPVEQVTGRQRKLWLHHGSSISHGSNADSPTQTWVALAAAQAGVELTNLGFGGGALLDPFTARTMRDLPADLISVKLGINLVNLDLLHQRAFGPAVHGFLDTIRDGHPTTPLLVISSIHCPIHEDTPGPGVPDFSDGKVQFRATGDPGQPGKLTLNWIRQELAAITEARAKTDPNLSYLDGRDLYGEADFAELPLPDQLHPDNATHRRMAERFAKLPFLLQ